MNIQCWHKEFDNLFYSITPTNLGQFSKPGTNLKSAGPDGQIVHEGHILKQVLAEIYLRLKTNDTILLFS